MADEIKLTAGLSFYKPLSMGGAIGRAVQDFTASVDGAFWSEGTILVSTAPTEIPLGQIITPHWCYFRNLDPVFYITIRNGSAGTDLIGLLAGEPAFVPLLFTAEPWAVAPDGAALLEFLMISL